MLVTYLVSTPWIHIHYLTTDEEADKQGFAQVDLVCMRCEEKERLEFKLPPLGELRKHDDEGIPELRARRDGFELRHQHGRPTHVCFICNPEKGKPWFGEKSCPIHDSMRNPSYNWQGVAFGGWTNEG